MIKTLTSWRGIFALCIVCFHFAMHEFDAMTMAGVTFFFMLSGFLVTYKHSLIASVEQFYRRRMFRIFPLHLLTLVLMILLDLIQIHKFHYGWDLTLHVGLLQSWVPDEAVYYNYSIHSWFLSSLLACIIATPLLVKLIARSSRATSWAAMSCACLVMLILSLIPGERWHSYRYVFPIARLVDYSLGMLIGNAMRECSKPQHVTLARATMLELGSLAIFAIFIALHTMGAGTVDQQLETSALWWIPMSALIITSAKLHGNEGIVGKILSLPPLLWLGEISFEVYILQKLVNNAFCYIIAPFFGHFGILIYDYSFACTVPLLIVVAWVVNRLFSHFMPLKKPSTGNKA